MSSASIIFHATHTDAVLLREWINAESKWLAARYGLDAIYIRTPSGKRSALRQDLDALFERLMPVARESGDHAHLLKIQPLDKLETGAERQRRLFREHGEWQAIIRDSVKRLSAELKGAATPTAAKAEAEAKPPSEVA